MKTGKLFINFLMLIIVLSHYCYAQSYDDYVKANSYDYNGEKYYVACLNRKGEHVKAKYFALPQNDKFGNSMKVPARYIDWATGKNVVTFASGAYSSTLSTPDGIPVGLTIDNGNIVNPNLITDKMDGLVIVYATGGIVATNLKEGNLTTDNNKQYDIMHNQLDLEDFKKWAHNSSATVFQTHLLVYKNKFLVGTNGATSIAKRRFLAVGHDYYGNVIHTIISTPNGTIFNASASAYNVIINNKILQDITFMINLDTGARDIARVYNSQKQYYDKFEGAEPFEKAINLIAYYYE